MISYYITKSNIPYVNQSIEDILMENVKENEVILYLWQNENTVVVGRNQNAFKECRMSAFEEENGNLMRRVTGGGAVYQDMGNQIFSFIAPKNLYNLEKQIEVIRLAAASFGINAEKIGRNDILANGKKFSGNAFRKTKNTIVHHGTILISTDMTKLATFLNPSKEKLKSKGVDSVQSRVINLNELNKDITPEIMQKALIKAFEEVYKDKAVEIKDSEIDKKKLKSLVEYYSNDDWKLGTISNFNYNICNRFSFGEIDINLSVENGIVKNAKIHSDILDANWILDIEKNLLNINFNKNNLVNAIPKIENTNEYDELIKFLNNLEI
ncbi:MAG: lipoate--protein ligase [Defluviitaleaceae bacterium]|nr:lipoate--protein ligase [Defluviitaleaceae bacterium]